MHFKTPSRRQYDMRMCNYHDYYKNNSKALQTCILFNVVMKPGSVLLPRINKFTFSVFFILSSPLGLLFSLMAFLVWLLSYTAKKAMTTVF